MKEIIPSEDIQPRIYRIRGQQVMLDADLAKLYGVPTKRLNEQVRRNWQRFPADFMFQLSIVEETTLRSQIATSIGGRGGRRYRPFAFTEHGIAMLSTVLNSEKAIQITIAIIRFFIRCRRAILASRDLAVRVEKLERTAEVCKIDMRLMFEDIQQLKKRNIPPGPIPPSII